MKEKTTIITRNKRYEVPADYHILVDGASTCDVAVAVECIGTDIPGIILLTDKKKHDMDKDDIRTIFKFCVKKYPEIAKVIDIETDPSIDPIAAGDRMKKRNGKIGATFWIFDIEPVTE